MQHKDTETTSAKTRIKENEIAVKNAPLKRINICCPKCGEISSVPKNMQIQFEYPQCSQTLVGSF